MHGCPRARSTLAGDKRTLILSTSRMNLLFDLDGTLTDSRPGIVACIRHALQRASIPSPTDQELQRWVGPPLAHSFAQLLGAQRDAACVAQAIASYRERFTTIGMFENSVYDQVHATLEELCTRGARLYLATSKPRVYAERILEHFELAPRFTAIFGSELDGRLSEKTDLIAHVLKHANLDPTDSIMIGDREHDMLGAVHNNVYPAGALWGYGSVEELRGAGARQLLAAPTEIPRLLAAVS
jgi:phosphoglycolate phosphatase